MPRTTSRPKVDRPVVHRRLGLQIAQGVLRIMNQLEAADAPVVKVVETPHVSFEAIAAFTGQKRCQLAAIANGFHLPDTGGKTNLFAPNEIFEVCQLARAVGPGLAGGKGAVHYPLPLGIATQCPGISDDTEESRRQSALAHLRDGPGKGLVAFVFRSATLREIAGMTMQVDSRMALQKIDAFRRLRD